MTGKEDPGDFLECFLLNHSFIVKAIILSVCYNNVVDETDVHCLSAFLDKLRQALVVCTGAWAAGRMVVYQSYLCGSLY